MKEKHGTNALPVKTGDSVRVLRGDRQGFEGKITRVDRQSYRIFVEGVTREKVDGSTIQIPIHPSKVMLTNLDLGDKWRREALKRKGIPPTKPTGAIAAEKPAKKKKKVQKRPEPRKTAKKERKQRKKPESEKPSAPKKTEKPKKTRKPRVRHGKAKTKEGAR